MDLVIAARIASLRHTTEELIERYEDKSVISLFEDNIVKLSEDKTAKTSGDRLSVEEVRARQRDDRPPSMKAGTHQTTSTKEYESVTRL